jgi:hypothetical protein
VSDLERLKKIMVSQGINIEDDRFVRAFRIFENPAGCEDCGARTKVAVPNPKKKNSYMTGCCKKVIG